MQNLTLNCSYFVTSDDKYACLITDNEVLIENQNVIIGGQHMEGRTEADVEFVRIADSNIS